MQTENVKEEIRPQPDDSEVICLSSDDEDIPPKRVITPVHIQKPTVIDDDDVVILSGKFKTFN